MPRRNRFTVRILGVAEQDLSEIYEYIAADNPTVADRLLTRLEKALQHLAKAPSLGRIPNDPDIARFGYRYLVIGDYLAFYKLEGSAIIICRIVHGARDCADLL